MIKRQEERKFELVSKFNPAGDQQQAIDKLAAGFKKGYKEQILEGATGTGKTFTMANIISCHTMIITNLKHMCRNQTHILKRTQQLMMKLTNYVTKLPVT